MTRISKASKVSNLLKKHPDWSVAEVAAQAGCAANYVYMVRTKIRKNVLELTKDQEVTDQMEPLGNEASNALLHSISQGKGRDPVVGTMRPTTEDKVEKILNERQSEYGSYMQSADTTIKLKGIMHNAIARNDLHLFPDQLLSLDMIAVKISRIVNGNPAHRDSWIDIAGYATLVADRLQGKTR